MKVLKEISEYLYKQVIRVPKIKQFLSGNAEYAAGILFPGSKNRQWLKKYEMKRLLILLSGVTLGILLLIVYIGLLFRSAEYQQRLLRSSDMEIAVNFDLDAELEDGTQIGPLSYSLNPRVYSVSERQDLYRNVKAYIQKYALGKNKDFEHIEYNLNLMTEIDNYPVYIEWYMEDYNLIHSDGQLGDLSDVKLPVQTEITAKIIYDQEETDYKIPITIIGSHQTLSIEDQITALLQEQDDLYRDQASVELPDHFDGQNIYWRIKKDKTGLILPILVIIISILLFYYQNERLKQQMITREQQLKKAYPGFVHRMVLMLGAGMTVRKSFEMLSLMYEKHPQLYQNDAYLYKEMKFMLRQMDMGESESKMYMALGQRTGLSEYTQFIQLLLQYIKKGNTGMQEMMQTAAFEAEKKKRDQMKMMGETAGTKMLFPMMILLCLIMILIMIPAWINFR